MIFFFLGLWFHLCDMWNGELGELFTEIGKNGFGAD